MELPNGEKYTVDLFITSTSNCRSSSHAFHRDTYYCVGVLVAIFYSSCSRSITVHDLIAGSLSYQYYGIAVSTASY